MRSLYLSALVFSLSLVLTSCGMGGETSSGTVLESSASQGITAKSTNLLMGRYQDYNAEHVSTLLKDANKKVLLYVYGPTCQECRASTLAIIKSFNTLQSKDIVGFRLVLGQDKAFEKAHAISKAGTLIVFKGTEEIIRKEGALTEAEVMSLLK